jgi:F-type H+-transporting ATPase subunit b
MFTRIVSGLLIVVALVAFSRSAAATEDPHPPEALVAFGRSAAATEDPHPPEGDHGSLTAPGHSAEEEHPEHAGDAHGADAHGEGAHGGGGSVNPLALEELQGDLAVWTAMVFLVLLAILWKFAWGPLTRGLEKREQGIADQIARAEQSNQQAQELLAQYEQKLAESGDEVRGILDQARRDAEQLGREMLEKTKAEAEAEQQRALGQIDAATAGALKELAEHSADLAVELAGKIVRAELKPDDHVRLIQQAVANFAERPPSNN